MGDRSTLQLSYANLVPSPINSLDYRDEIMMNLHLSPDLQEFTNGQIASGKYASLDEMVLAGLQALAERERVYQGRFEELRAEILSGAQEAENGNLLNADEEINHIRQRLRH